MRFSKAMPFGSGLELYTTLDGAVAAAARYAEGMPIESVFLGDPHLSHADRLYRLRYLMRGIYISRKAAGITRGESDWFDFGGRDCFYDSTGSLYFVVRFNNVASATQDFDGTMGPCVNGKALGSGGGGGDDNGPEGGGGGGGSSPDPFGPPKGPDPIGPSELPPYPGNGGGGGSSNPKLPNNDDRTTPDRPNLPDFTEPRPSIPIVDPLPDKILCPICNHFPCICEKEVDCEEMTPEAGDNSVKTTRLLDEIAALPMYAEFLKITENTEVEYSTAAFRDENGTLNLLEPYTDHEKNRVNILISRVGTNLACFHNHPQGYSFSIDDVTMLIRLYMLHGKTIKYLYVKARSTIYALYIYDETMVNNFYQTGYYHTLFQEYESIYNYLSSLFFNGYDARLYGTAYLLEKGKTGIAILSRTEDDNRFHQHRTECMEGLPET